MPGRCTTEVCNVPHVDLLRSERTATDAVGRLTSISTADASQFLESYLPQGYPEDVKRSCLKRSVNGVGFREIERVTDISHNSIINWVKQVAETLPDVPESEEIPEIAEVDELQMFVGQKKIKVGCGLLSITGVAAFWLGGWQTGVLKPLSPCGTPARLVLLLVCHCFRSVGKALGYLVYPGCINQSDPLVSKTYIGRVEARIHDYGTTWLDCTVRPFATLSLRKCSSSRFGFYYTASSTKLFLSLLEALHRDVMP